MFKSKKILTAVLAVVLVIGMFPFGALTGLFGAKGGLKVSAQENIGDDVPLLTIGTIGDPHTDYNLQNVDPYIRTSYITAMDALKAEDIDLLLVGGDMTSDNEAGTSAAFRWDTEVYDRTISQYQKYSAAASKTGKTLWACGNHDYEVGVLYDGSASDGDYDAYKGFTDMMVEDCGEPRSLFTQSMDTSAPSTTFGDFWLGAHYVINGFDFIVINSPHHRSTYYTTGTLNWLDQTLAGIGSDKTVFITGHYPLYDNRGLHSLADGLKDTNYTNFVNVLNKYDNAIYLYGHEHGGRSTSQLCDTIYSSADSFERITHYAEDGSVINDRTVNPTSFITAFMGSASFYNYSLNPNWLGAADPEIVQAMTITVYENRIVFKVINCGEQEGAFRDILTWTVKRDVLASGDVDLTDPYETFELPMDWSTGTSRDSNGWDIPVKGNWSIGGFSNLDTATRINQHSSKTTEELRGAAANGDNNVKSAPQPYIGNNYNESIVQNTTVTANGTSGWYVNYAYRWSGTVVKAGGSYIKATAVAGKPGAIVFTAPSDGYYSYSEIFKTVIATTGAEYEATVRRNGQILDKFEITTAGIVKNFKGKIMLNAGDMLMFAFEQKTTLATKDDPSHCANIQSIVVEKHPVPANYKGAKDLTPKFDIGSFTDVLGNVTLMGYDMSAPGVGAEKLYPISSYEKTLDTDAKNPNKWIAIDPKGQNKGNYLWGGLKSGYNHLWAISSVSGYITDVGGAQETRYTGAALVFEAPQTGIYKLYAELGTTFCKTFTVYHDYIIMKGDGTELVNKNNVGAADSSKTVIETTVMLEKGEEVMILKLPNSSSAKFNTSCNGTAKIEITELEHICTAETLGEVTDAVAPDCKNPGTVEYYTCYCDAIYGDANAETALESIVDPSTGHADEGKYAPIDNTTHKFDRACCDYEDATSEHDFVDGYCATCDYTCAHTWENGFCTNCQINCAHNWNVGTCTVCQITCDHDWNTDTGVCNTCGLGCDHDWNAETGKCGICGYACKHTVSEDDANCLADALCEICGYFYTNPDNHINSKYAVPNGDGTHDWLCHGCDEVIGSNEKCTYENNVCDKCGYDRTIEVETNDVKNAINNILNGGNATITVVGPATTMDEAFVVEKIENVVGYEYKLFNVTFDDNDNVILRNHLIVEGELPTVTVDGKAVTLLTDDECSDGVYYFDITPVAGKYDVPSTVEINGDTYNVSLYSYIKLALEGTEVELTDAERTLLKALYDLNEAMR